MFTSTSMLSLVGALVSAGSYCPPDELRAESPAVTAQAVADIAHARVELYCGHDGQAVADLRAARASLQKAGGPTPAAALAALDEASWHARRGRYQSAELALQHALEQLSPDSTNTAA